MPYRLMNEYTVAVLGYDAVGDEDVMDPLGRGPAVWLQQLDPRKPLRHATHVDISVPHDAGEAPHRGGTRRAGGRLADDSHAPEWWTLADPVGNKVDIATWTDHD